MNQSKLFVDGRLHRGNAKRLTASINDLSTYINYVKRSPQWDIQCADFLLNVIDCDPRLQDRNGLPVKCFHEALHYVRNTCEASLNVAESAEAQMQLQLDVVNLSLGSALCFCSSCSSYTHLSLKTMVKPVPV